jgi:hypothetical protein
MERGGPKNGYDVRRRPEVIPQAREEEQQLPRLKKCFVGSSVVTSPRVWSTVTMETE